MGGYFVCLNNQYKLWCLQKCVKKLVQKQYKYTTVKVCQKVESKPREVDKWKAFEKRKKILFSQGWLNFMTTKFIPLKNSLFIEVNVFSKMTSVVNWTVHINDFSRYGVHVTSLNCFLIKMSCVNWLSWWQFQDNCSLSIIRSTYAIQLKPLKNRNISDVFLINDINKYSTEYILEILPSSKMV